MLYNAGFTYTIELLYHFNGDIWRADEKEELIRNNLATEVCPNKIACRKNSKKTQKPYIVHCSLKAYYIMTFIT